jgi:hypothetical protein
MRNRALFVYKHSPATCQERKEGKKPGKEEDEMKRDGKKLKGEKDEVCNVKGV